MLAGLQPAGQRLWDAAKAHRRPQSSSAMPANVDLEQNQVERKFVEEFQKVGWRALEAVELRIFVEDQRAALPRQQGGDVYPGAK